MNFTLTRPFSRNSTVDPADVIRMKRALNRLGYYMPPAGSGITGVADAATFAGLAVFQGDRGLPPTGTAKPADATVDALNQEVSRRKTGKFIWRSVGDDRVRADHQALNGTIRDYADSPDPGEEVNCRCWAESLDCQQPFVTQNLLDDTEDLTDSWSWWDFFNHFDNGNGQAKKLEEIGFFAKTVAHVEEEIYPRVEDQVIDRARQIGGGRLEYRTERAYDFKPVTIPFGYAVLRSHTAGSVEPYDNCRIIQAQVSYEFDDLYTDVLGLRQAIFKSSSPEVAGIPKDHWTEFGGTAYQITGKWKTIFSALIPR